MICVNLFFPDKQRFYFFYNLYFLPVKIQQPAFFARCSPKFYLKQPFFCQKGTLTKLMNNAAYASDWRGTATVKRQRTLFAPPLRDHQIRLWKNAAA